MSELLGLLSNEIAGYRNKTKSGQKNPSSNRNQLMAALASFSHCLPPRPRLAPSLSPSCSSSRVPSPSSPKPERPRESPGAAAIMVVAAGAAGLAAAAAAAQAVAVGPPPALMREPQNALSLPRWAVHVSSVIEWVTAMALVWEYGEESGIRTWKGLSWGMVPLLGGALCACTWHFFYNSESLEILVAMQAALTVIGNLTMCIAAYRIFKASQEGSNSS